MTLLEYGIEGTHYNKNADGTITFIKEKRDTYQPWRNGMGNITQLPPLDGEGAGFWDTFKAYYSAAKEIPILGFAFNASDVETELGALTNVGTEYALALNTGTIDPAAKLPEFLKKLDDNGMQKVVDAANAQLDAFLAAKGQ